jgi:hypothetical protein
MNRERIMAARAALKRAKVEAKEAQRAVLAAHADLVAAKIGLSK